MNTRIRPYSEYWSALQGPAYSSELFRQNFVYGILHFFALEKHIAPVVYDIRGDDGEISTMTYDKVQIDAHELPQHDLSTRLLYSLTGIAAKWQFFWAHGRPIGRRQINVTIDLYLPSDSDE